MVAGIYYSINQFRTRLRPIACTCSALSVLGTLLTPGLYLQRTGYLLLGTVCCGPSAVECPCSSLCGALCYEPPFLRSLSFSRWLRVCMLLPSQKMRLLIQLHTNSRPHHM
jgi:hypothetical protein